MLVEESSFQSALTNSIHRVLSDYVMSFTDLSEPCQISQTHMLHRCNLIAIVGTGPGAKFFNDKGDIS